MLKKSTLKQETGLKQSDHKIKDTRSIEFSCSSWLTLEMQRTESCKHSPTVGQHSLQNKEQWIVP